VPPSRQEMLADMATRLKDRWNVYGMQHLINGFVKENGERDAAAQLRELTRFLDGKDPDRHFLSLVVEGACKASRYKISQFKAFYSEEQSRLPTVAVDAHPAPSAQGLGAYRETFDRRAEEGLPKEGADE